MPRGTRRNLNGEDKELVTLDLFLHKNIGHSVFVSDDEEEKNAKWINKNKIKCDGKVNTIVKATMTQATAEEKGFV